MKFKEYIKEARENAGLSQADVANKLGNISPQYMSNIERGICHPSAEALKVMCSMYGVNYQQAANMVLVEYLHKKEMIFKRNFKV